MICFLLSPLSFLPLDQQHDHQNGQRVRSRHGWNQMGLVQTKQAAYFLQLAMPSASQTKKIADGIRGIDPA